MRSFFSSTCSFRAWLPSADALFLVSILQKKSNASYPQHSSKFVAPLMASTLGRNAENLGSQISLRRGISRMGLSGIAMARDCVRTVSGIKRELTKDPWWRECTRWSCPCRKCRRNILDHLAWCVQGLCETSRAACRFLEDNLQVGSSEHLKAVSQGD